MSLIATRISLQIRANLISKGFSLAAWSRFKGFDPVAVQKYLTRWIGRPQRPRGEKTREIIIAIESETGIKICG